MIDIPGLKIIQDGDYAKAEGMYCLDGYDMPKTLAHVLPYSDEPNTWAVLSIRVHPDWRGRGLAAKILKCITAAADAYGVKLLLAVEPQKPMGLDETKLMAWYGRAGFVGDPQYDGYIMRRQPSPATPQNPPDLGR
jgi:GNAT superfamily N-acetyltransferase